MADEEPDEEWPAETDSEPDEPTDEDAAERSPVGAMDRDSTELGPAGAGAPPGGSGEESADSDEHESDAAAGSETRTPDSAGADSEASAVGEDAGGPGEAPLSDLRDELSERGDVADEEFEELFEEVDVGTVDEESLWDELSETAEEPVFTADPEAVQDADVTVVEKSLCHRCPHFGDPPELHCTHEGTTIDAEVDTEHFRVVDCPIVAQQADVDASDFSTDDR
jgi:hypothetical protein